VERRIARDEANPYHYFPHLTFPMVRFAGVSSGRRNFAVISGGLKENEALENEARTFTLAT